MLSVISKTSVRKEYNVESEFYHLQGQVRKLIQIYACHLILKTKGDERQIDMLLNGFEALHSDDNVFGSGFLFSDHVPVQYKDDFADGFTGVLAQVRDEIDRIIRLQSNLE